MAIELSIPAGATNPMLFRTIWCGTLRLPWLVISMLITGVCPAKPAHAAEFSIAAISAQGVDSDLLQLLPKVLDGSLQRESSFSAGAILARRIEAHWFKQSCGEIEIRGCALALEATVLKHSGRQTPWEVAGGLRIGADLYASTSWRIGFATTQGFSNVFGTPSYEDGPKDDPNRRYRFQYHMAFELETTHAAWSGWSVGLRVHHRSGMYGIVAPPRVGSNFVGLVVRHELAAD